MKKVLLSLLLGFATGFSALAQQTMQVNTDLYGNFNISLSFSGGRRNSVVLDTNGTIIHMPVGGRTEVYDHWDGRIKAGKIKSVNGIVFDYYDQFDGRVQEGRIKSIGGIKVEYYDQFDGRILEGRLKNIGSHAFVWHDQFDGRIREGKIKSIGGVPFQYYDQFDFSYESGKIKSIGSHPFTYFSVFDGGQWEGRLKSYSQRFEENGIRFVVDIPSNRPPRPQPR
jgi:hypothetical protein